MSYEKVAGILEAQGERGQALGEYRKSLAIRERLAASDPSNALWQTDLVVSLVRISTLVGEVQGKQMLQQALSILLSLNAQNRLTQAQQQWIGIIQQQLES